jgi:methyl-accepting chemotaxis protein
MVVSIAVVLFIMTQQNRTASNDRLEKAIDIIREDLSAKQTKLLTDTVQLSHINEMGRRMKFLLEYKGDDSLASLTKNTYIDISKDTYQVARTSDLARTAVYDLQGDLVSFAVRQDEDKVIMGYNTASGSNSLKSAVLKPGQGLDENSWNKIDTLPDNYLKLKFDKDIPKEVTSFFESIDNSMCLVSYAPVFADETGKDAKGGAKQQCGFAVAVLRIDETFVKKMSYLTSMKVNLFTMEGLSSGDLAEYKALRTEPVNDPTGKWELAKQETTLDEAMVQEEDYFQGVLFIYGEKARVGAIAALLSKHVAKENTRQMTWLLASVYLGAILLILPVSIYLSSSVTKPINRAISSLTEVANEVTAASGHVASSSQRVADNASEQAASLEETSSSLEQMSSMTRHNMESAGHCDDLSHQVVNYLENADQSMKALIHSMEETSSASDKVARIIKSIDEIAFQTNLLALNAAVEAARAGEAGAGFAVVADEVRNLAMRAAEAAKNTQEMVGEIIRKTSEGSGRVKETYDKYRDLTVMIQKVTDLIAEIAGASKEQAQGIEQINKAITDIDGMTQQSAANAEESAAASEQLSAQAEQMRSVVVQLVSLVGGNGNGNGHRNENGTGHEKKSLEANSRARLDHHATSARKALMEP